MEVRLRTTRTLKVTELKITDEEREMMADLFKTSYYEALLDVMERACIEIETAHLTTPMGDPEGILGGFAVTKACWLFFQYVQRQVQSAYMSRATDEEEKPPEPTLDEFLQGVE